MNFEIKTYFQLSNWFKLYSEDKIKCLYTTLHKSEVKNNQNYKKLQDTEILSLWRPTKYPIYVKILTINNKNLELSTNKYPLISTLTIFEEIIHIKEHFLKTFRNLFGRLKIYLLEILLKCWEQHNSQTISTLRHELYNKFIKNETILIIVHCF